MLCDCESHYLRLNINHGEKLFCKCYVCGREWNKWAVSPLASVTNSKLYDGVDVGALYEKLIQLRQDMMAEMDGGQMRSRTGLWFLTSKKWNSSPLASIHAPQIPTKVIRW